MVAVVVVKQTKGKPMNAEPENTWDSEYAICPYCGNRHRVESEDYSESGEEEECEKCGKHDMRYTEISVDHMCAAMDQPKGNEP
jgi:predicted RNA-binding Zn-ribbon protein involved in translation (DUF1610 family)